MLGGIPDSLIAGFLDLLRQSGRFGPLAAAVLIGLTLSLIIFARAKNLWDDGRGRTQSLELGDRLLKMVDSLQASEQALRERLAEMSRETSAQRDEIDELRAGIALLRSQRRRLIELMRGSQNGAAKGSRV